MDDFTWIDGERLVRFGTGVLADAPKLLEQRDFDGYVLLTTERAEASAPRLVEAAAAVLRVPPGSVPDGAAADKHLRDFLHFDRRLHSRVDIHLLERILEGKQGMAAGMSSDADPAKLVDRFGSRWTVLETSFKFHASCRHTHPAADALLQVLQLR